MWITTAIGLAFFGVTTEALDPNQLHLLFAPIMTAYGLAFVSILWSRLDFVASTPMLRNVHHFVIVVICALPLVLSLPQKVRVGMHAARPRRRPALAALLRPRPQQQDLRPQGLGHRQTSRLLRPTVGRRMVCRPREHLAATDPRGFLETRNRRLGPADPRGRAS